MTITAEQLEEWRKLASWATDRGEWRVMHGAKGRHFVGYTGADGHDILVAQALLRNERANAAFIAASRTAVPALVAEVERLREALRKLKDRLEDDDATYFVVQDWPEFTGACAALPEEPADG